MKIQTAVLISVAQKASVKEINENLKELKELAISAGLKPLCELKQKLKNIHPGFLIGEGKKKELEQKIRHLKPHYVIFDHKLSGIQTRNLEKLLKIPVLDRSQLILKIFAQRAQSHEGKLQVELAQLLDEMSRMTGAWLGSLSRQGGKKAAKGPGEKALETDRRQIQSRKKRIQEKLQKVKNSRLQRRSTRLKKQIPSFALIGYTNSGKSALLNRLTHFNAEVKNQSFMTLDPKTRKLFIPGSGKALITDTVGFIRNLPPHLISAFQSTLEESAVADVILHVMDFSHPKKKLHIQVVDTLIKELGWDKKPILYVFNKMDLLSPGYHPLPSHCRHRVLISALKGWNIKNLLLQMKTMI